MRAVPSMPIRLKASTTACAAPSWVSFIISARTMLTCTSTRSAFAGPNASSSDTRCAGRAGDGKSSNHYGPKSLPPFSCRQSSSQLSDANCAEPCEAASRSNAPLLSLVDKGDLTIRTKQERLCCGLQWFSSQLLTGPRRHPHQRSSRRAFRVTITVAPVSARMAGQRPVTLASVITTKTPSAPASGPRSDGCWAAWPAAAQPGRRRPSRDCSAEPCRLKRHVGAAAHGEWRLPPAP